MKPSPYDDCPEWHRMWCVSGCGPKQFSWLIPDKMWGLDISLACHRHDCALCRATSEEDLLLANYQFEDDLLEIINDDRNRDGFIERRKAQVRTYFQAVRMFGWLCTSFENECTREIEGTA